MSFSSSADQTFDVEVSAVQPAALLTNVYELRALGGQALPAYSPGAHIDVHLPNDLTRQYSLTRPFQDGAPYAIGVKRDASSRGGSAYFHDSVKPGDRLKISRPRNNFPLVESAEESVLIAGGVGITPIWCMVQRLAECQRPWRLIYAARQRGEAAFVDEIARLGGDVRFHFDDEQGGVLDLGAAVGRLKGDIHAYCCGPAPMLDAFKQACAGHYDDCVHVEYFTSAVPAAVEGGYEIELARRDITMTVPAGKTILETLLDAGIDYPYACQQGVCGSCEARVISGTPDHRDMILTADEKAANWSMMICCSGSLGPRLVLDI
jgi:ferredoxin-NADP reductase